MATQLINFADHTPITLMAHHLSQWFQLQDYLRSIQAPTNQLDYCRNKVTRLQLDLKELQNSQ